jgi:hypothetical protein
MTLDEYIERYLQDHQIKFSESYIQAKNYDEACWELDKGNSHE